MAQQLTSSEWRKRVGIEPTEGQPNQPHGDAALSMANELGTRASMECGLSSVGDGHTWATVGPRRERRNRTVQGRVARATYPAREAVVEAMEDLPCRLLGHHWVEVPHSLRRSARSDGERMRFRCSRCSLVGGFSN
jgi:hypothetical protein